MGEATPSPQLRESGAASAASPPAAGRNEKPPHSPRGLCGESLKAEISLTSTSPSFTSLPTPTRTRPKPGPRPATAAPSQFTLYSASVTARPALRRSSARGREEEERREGCEEKREEAATLSCRCSDQHRGQRQPQFPSETEDGREEGQSPGLTLTALQPPTAPSVPAQLSTSPYLFLTTSHGPALPHGPSRCCLLTRLQLRAQLMELAPPVPLQPRPRSRSARGKARQIPLKRQTERLLRCAAPPYGPSWSRFNQRPLAPLQKHALPLRPAARAASRLRSGFGRSARAAPVWFWSRVARSRGGPWWRTVAVWPQRKAAARAQQREAGARAEGGGGGKGVMLQKKEQERLCACAPIPLQWSRGRGSALTSHWGHSFH